LAIVVFSSFLSIDSSRPFQKWDIISAHLLSGVDVGNYSTPSFVDVDGDGDMDAFIGESYGTIVYYENTGTPQAPAFTLRTGVANPLGGVDVGDYSAPSFVDVDGDGDMDAFIGEYDGIINYYKNTGTPQAPAFTQQTAAANPFNGVDVGNYSAPSFVDVDGDGDMDAFIGESSGRILYYENTGTPQAPAFTQPIGGDNPLGGANVGSYSAPSFVDVDGDGDMDAFIGEYNGTIVYYENTGTLQAPAFTKRTGAANPLGGVKLGYHSTPSFVDVDGDGDMDAFIGEGYGTIVYYENTGTPQAPAFTQRTGAANPLGGVDVEYHSAPSFVDVDGDGDMDAFIGEYYGIINYYENTGTPQAPAFTQRTGASNPLGGVNVGSYSAPSFVDVDGDGDMDAFIGEYYGIINYYENTGTPQAPVFTQRTGAANPLGGVNVGYYSTPSFVDVDGDGDMDVFIGEYYGTIVYYGGVQK